MKSNPSLWDTLSQRRDDMHYKTGAMVLEAQQFHQNDNFDTR
jgi:hypothetical protein